MRKLIARREDHVCIGVLLVDGHHHRHALGQRLHSLECLGD